MLHFLYTNTTSVTPVKDSPATLSSLKEITQPADISWLPETTGWKILLLLALCYLLYRIYLIINQYLQNAYRRAAIIELDNLTHSNLALLPHIIRRTALYSFDRTQVAPLIGAEWEHWLDEQCQGCAFSTHYKGQLSQLAYANGCAIKDTQALALKSHAIYWIKNHRGPHD